MMDLDLSCVASFLILMEEQHFGRAATRLHMVPSTLTKRVQRLERQVGVPLIVRDATGVLGPTPAGRRLAAEGEALLAHACAVRASVRAEPPIRAVWPPQSRDWRDRQPMSGTRTSDAGQQNKPPGVSRSSSNRYCWAAEVQALTSAARPCGAEPIPVTLPVLGAEQA